MRVEFDLISDDLIAFIRFYAEDYRKKHARAILIAMPIMMPLLVLIIGRPEKTWEFWLMLFGSVAALEILLWFLLCSFPYQILLNRSIDRITPKIIREAQTRGILDKHIIIINEQGLVENFKEHEYYWTWSGIERIDQNGTHIFMVIDSIRAPIIPKKAFTNTEQAIKFYNAAKTFHTRG